MYFTPLRSPTSIALDSSFQARSPPVEAWGQFSSTRKGRRLAISILATASFMGDFEPSELGTKAHWDSHYERELQNFDEASDIGDIWFGQQSEKRVLKYLSDVGIPSESRILDVGSGNGHLAIELVH
nr:unnamed protein product [Spirometra erinaceieuropaei]